MKYGQLLRGFLLASVVVPSGSAWGGSLAHMDWNANIVANALNTVSENRTDQVEDSSSVSAFDFFNGADQGQDGENPPQIYSAIADVGYQGHARIGSIGAGVSGQAIAQTASAIAFFSSAEADATVRVFWFDNAQVSSPTAAPGQTFRVDASLILEGHFSGSVDGQIITNHHAGQWSTSVALDGIGQMKAANNATGTTGNTYFSGGLGSGPFTEDIVETLPISYFVTNGEYDLLGEQLTLFGGTRSDVDFVGPGPVTAQFSSNLNDTLRWGGISQIVDTSTGEPLTDFTIQSDSGFDYRNPAPVPEPATGAAILTGAFLLLLQKQKHASPASA